jgi:hypothetical protein
MSLFVKKDYFESVDNTSDLSIFYNDSLVTSLIFRQAWVS